MPHPLDRSIWQALTTRQAALRRGTGDALCYDPDFTPFAATRDDRPASLAALADIIPQGGRVALFNDTALAFPDSLNCVHRDEALQMMLDRPAPPADPAIAFRPLGAADGPAMAALVELTRPGPFARRTWEMGRYVGVFDGTSLVAMAGERLQLDGFVELSAVCTHPDHRGRGLAAALMRHLAGRVVDAGDTPFLHVFRRNIQAISVYRRLGFVERRLLHLAVVGSGAPG